MVNRPSWFLSRGSSALSSTISNDDDLLPGISAIQEANDQLSEELGSLRNSPYFRLYCVDILASCEYMPQELFECYTESCEIYPIDDDVVRFILVLSVCLVAT